MLKYTAIPILCLTLFWSCNQNPKVSSNETNPKLVVGIVVDQMRYDYLTRFYNKYGEGGFKRMMREGYNCKNNHFNYIPTKTGPGHASIYTGTTPKYHGIIGNDWYDKILKETVYCVGDTSIRSVGTNASSGQMSPHRLKTTTFADENRLFTQGKGKTIGISLKDRGAVLPAGHTANAAYWFHGGEEGIWISSTHYMDELPNWVKLFNAEHSVTKYLTEWNTFHDISTYTESGLDLNAYERGFNGKDSATFPYPLDKLKDANGGFDILKTTAYGNNLVTDFALAALTGEDLGQDAVTDILAVSYSSTDYVGHNFGVNSKEIEDTYIRLDKDLERLLKGLDDYVGKNNYTLFLTADHAAVNVPAYLQSVKIPAGYLNHAQTRRRFESFMEQTFNSAELIENISNDQIFLNRRLVHTMGLKLEEVQERIVNELINYPHVYQVYSATTMSTSEFTIGIEALLQKGFNQKRSGDILIVPDPAFISYPKTGSTHGSGFNYDTHVPLLFFGKGIMQGSTHIKTEITDIAPTMSALLGISFPNAAIGQPLDFVLE
ncbi:alkaline phosphatase PafA [Aestuariivivens sediminicola]|uniref:alkaline phosphatase PafA n=1 Tax=Aestuariivivens sediminicola TaxID=2913560 RepID=UPI001F562447|nr:alkaline phosphatase PafA [Aestuariivivens sediminicola]